MNLGTVAHFSLSVLGWCSSPERFQWSECLYFSQPLDISTLSSATLINLSLRTICPFGIQTFPWFSFLYRNTRHTNPVESTDSQMNKVMASLIEAHTQVLFQTSFLPRWLVLIHGSVSSCGMRRCLRGGCMSGDVTPAPWSFIGAAAGAHPSSYQWRTHPERVLVVTLPAGIAIAPLIAIEHSTEVLQVQGMSDFVCINMKTDIFATMKIFSLY